MAIQRMRDALRKNKAGFILLIVSNAPLALTIFGWLYGQLEAPGQKEDLIARFLVYVEPFEKGLHCCHVDTLKGLVGLETYGGDVHNVKSNLLLTVVDEAHHIYKDAALSKQIETYTSCSKVLWLLGDISQSLGHDIENQYPGSMKIVYLTEILRCTSRIVTASSVRYVSTF